MSRSAGVGTVVLRTAGIAGVVLWVAIAVGAWFVLTAVGDRLTDAVRTAGTAVGGMRRRLDRVDATLADVGESADALAAEAEARIRERIEGDLAALADVARGVDALLRLADDLPFLEVGRADAATAEALAPTLARALPGEGEAAPPAAAAVRAGVARVREGIAAWAGRLAGLERTLVGTRARIRRAVWVAGLLVTLLALWSAAGQVCLARRGRARPQRA